jgi:hypothetical protein
MKMPEIERPFRLGLNIKFKGRDLPLTAILGLLGTTAIWVVVVIMQPYSRWIGFAWIGIGVLIYWYTHRPGKSGQAETVNHA